MNKTLIALLLAVGLSGCGESGNEYAGRWVHAKSGDPCAAIDIEKVGGAWIVKIASFVNILGQMEMSPFTASIKDGQMQAKSGDDLRLLVIDKATGHLKSGGIEYRRRVAGDKECKALK